MEDQYLSPPLDSNNETSLDLDQQDLRRILDTNQSPRQPKAEPILGTADTPQQIKHFAKTDNLPTVVSHIMQVFGGLFIGCVVDGSMLFLD